MTIEKSDKPLFEDVGAEEIEDAIEDCWALLVQLGVLAEWNKTFISPRNRSS